MASKPGTSTSVGGSMNMGGVGASIGSGTSSSVSTQEYTVRMPKDRHRKLALMKFATGAGVDFAKLGNTTAKLERENNLKEYKTANDLDQLPKFGAGSEYGRDQKEEARRKKYGIVLKKYNPDEQPWHLKVGSGKQAKKYRGVREGTISDNTSYFIFTQCADGAFEAIPVEEWYNFSPMIRYKYLNSEEAEEEFSRRDKTLNFFNIMWKKRFKNEDKDHELDEEEKTTKGKGSKSKEKNFLLTDLEDWGADASDFDDDGDDGDEDDDERNKMRERKKKGKAAARGKKRVRNAKQNSDDEAIEESDEGDFDDREVDYMSASDSSSESEPEEKDKQYEEKGVADEGGLRNILNSDDEEEDEEEEVKEEEDIEEEEKKDEEKPSKEKRGSDDSSSDSDSDSDIDKDEKITSALLMQKDRLEKKKPGDKGDNKASGTTDSSDSRSLKRKAEGSDTTPAKKSRKDHSALPGSSNDGINEETIRRYLQRKPMTTKDLLQKFRSKKLNMTNEQMSNTIAQLLKRINPERTTINKKLYLSLKKPE